MRTYMVALFLVAATAVALPTPTDPGFGLSSVVDRRDEHGQYAYKYELQDGTVFSEQGTLKRTPDNKDNVLVKKGSFRYFSPEGQEVKGTYTADEHGYHLVSDSVPTPVQPVLV